jgi:hypothetical protein
LPSKTTNVFSGGAGQVGACQLAQFRSLVLKRLDQAGAFGLVRAELPLMPSAVSADRARQRLAELRERVRAIGSRNDIAQ